MKNHRSWHGVDYAEWGRGLPAERSHQATLLKAILSQHFKILREAGLIRSERKGVEMHNTTRCAELKERFGDMLTANLNTYAAQNSRRETDARDRRKYSICRLVSCQRESMPGFRQDPKRPSSMFVEPCAPWVSPHHKSCITRRMLSRRAPLVGH